MGKIEDRNLRELEEAASKEDWDTVEKILQRTQNNFERRDRYHKRKSLNYPIKQDCELLSIVTTEHQTPIDLIIQNEIREIVLDVVKSLDAKDAYILLSRYLDDTSYTSIAKDLGINRNTVSSHFKKICEILKVLLKDYFDDL